jgi:hypothetical protein
MIDEIQSSDIAQVNRNTSIGYQRSESFFPLTDTRTLDCKKPPSPAQMPTIATNLSVGNSIFLKPSELALRIIGHHKS